MTAARLSGERIFVWVLLLFTCLPWLLTGQAPVGWSLAAVLVAAVGLRSRRVAQLGVPVVAGICGYGAAATWGGLDVLPILGVGLLLMAIRLQGPGRSGPLTLLATCVGISLIAAVVVLRAANWTDDADRLRALLCGLAAGGALFLFARHEAFAAPRATCGFVVIVGLMACARQLVMPAADAPQLPAWHEVARDLGPPIGSDPRHALSQFERLRMVGVRDAALAWIGVALAENAAAEDLAPFCVKPGGVRALDTSWDSWVALGERACQALLMWPAEAGAAKLADQHEGALQRLRGDLLMQAGDIQGAGAAYAEATLRGDAFAQHDAAMALLLRGRLAEAAAKTAPDDTLTLIRLHPDLKDEAMWRAWNHAMDFVTAGSPERTGIVVRGGPGTLLNMYEPTRVRRVLTALPKDLDHFSVELPLPPGREVPGELSLRVQMRRSMRIELTNVEGDTLMYECRTEADNPLRKSLGSSVCNGSWTDITLQPAEALSGKLQRFALVGEFALAYITARPLEATP